MNRKTIIWFSLLFSILFYGGMNWIEVEDSYSIPFFKIEMGSVRNVESFVIVNSIIGFSFMIYFFISIINSCVLPYIEKKIKYEISENEKSEDL